MSDNTSKRRKSLNADIKEGVLSLGIYSKPDANGAQGIAETITASCADMHDTLIEHFALTGLAYQARQLASRLDDPQASDVQSTINAFLATVKDGTWTPGRTFESAEPDDLTVAIAEAMGQPVHVIMHRIETDVQKNPDGTPVLDKRGRTQHVFNKRMLAKIAEDPKVKPILARLTAERAKRLATESKKPGASSNVLDLFGTAAPAQQEQAAN